MISRAFQRKYYRKVEGSFEKDCKSSQDVFLNSCDRNTSDTDPSAGVSILCSTVAQEYCNEGKPAQASIRGLTICNFVTYQTVFNIKP